MEGKGQTIRIEIKKMTPHIKSGRLKVKKRLKICVILKRENILTGQLLRLSPFLVSKEARTMESKQSDPEHEKKELQTILSGLPNSQYLKILLAQVMRHYDPKITYIFQKKSGWQLMIEQYDGLLCRIIIHKDYFSVITPFPDFGITYLTPMVKVMSSEFREKFEEVSKKTKQIEMKVTNEEEMEDVIFLISLQAKKLRKSES